MMKYILLIALSFGLLTSCDEKKANHEGKVTFIKGDASLNRGGESLPLKVGSIVKQGDRIETAARALAIIIFENSAKLEVQPETIIEIESYGQTAKELFVKKGNLWIDVEKKQGPKNFRVRTPTSVAGVRGTSFYTFQFGDVSGTCHCEGEVDYEVKHKDYKGTHGKHEVVFFHKGKMVKLHQKHFTDRGVPWRETHAHSHIANSPLGPQYLPTKKEVELRQQVLKEFLVKAE